MPRIKNIDPRKAVERFGFEGIILSGGPPWVEGRPYLCRIVFTKANLEACSRKRSAKGGIAEKPAVGVIRLNERAGQVPPALGFESDMVYLDPHL